MYRPASARALPLLTVLGLVSAAALPAHAADKVSCSGHELLSNPRPESSCNDVKPLIYPSPDAALRALVRRRRQPYATPDMESQR